MDNKNFKKERKEDREKKNKIKNKKHEMHMHTHAASNLPLSSYTIRAILIKPLAPGFHYNSLLSITYTF